MVEPTKGLETDRPAFRYVYVDLHLHTVLSPCAEVEMIPPLIVAQAKQLGLGCIAVTDHSSAENVQAVMEAGKTADLVVLPGMEVQSREEVHLIVLFDTVEQVLVWQEQVYAHLPPLANRADTFGAQFVVDAEGEFVRGNERLLLASIDRSVEDIVAEVRALGGLCIPAHVDRPSFSLITNLGFVPPGLSFEALELSHLTDPVTARQRFPQLLGNTLIVAGDAHRLSEMHCGTMVKVRDLTIAELRMAFTGREGRRVIS
jgi:PHP family Zn ribbon phosphoesterase